MDINLKDFYYNKFLNYAINNNCFRSFKKHKDSIRKSINKIVDDHNDYLLTESLVNYMVNKDLYIKLAEIATNDKYLIYELFGTYYQELVNKVSYDTNNDETNIEDSSITNNLNLKTKDALIKVNKLFIDMCRRNDLNIYYFALMKLAVFYILTYCHINECMDKYDDLIGYYEDDIYKLKDEMIINGIDIAYSNQELIDLVSNGLINRNKKLIK